MNAFDGDNISSQMLQRVEVVADGTSPIYGADAIAGTVNYVLRSPFAGLEAYAQYGNTKGQDSWQGTAVGGYDWDSGGIIVSYQRTGLNRLRASARPSLYNDDYTRFGGRPSTDRSNPGNILINGIAYPIPAGQNGTALTLAQTGPAGSANRQNAFEGHDAVPKSSHDQLVSNFEQS
jgi:iron complex outermembrane receptor protein